MKRLVVAVVLGLVLGFAFMVDSHADIDTLDFPDASQRQRFHDLSMVLRCPKCQNQNLADSGAPIAHDLRGEIHRMLGEGKSDAQIIDFMVSRYGEFVLYDPALSSRTVLLWFGPAALLLAGTIALIFIVASRRRSRRVTGNALSDAERQRLAGLLQEADPSIEQNT
jgi:cytochrome c-type biogenesis protein CcmH